MIGSQLLIVNLHVVLDKTEKTKKVERQENMAGKSFDWFHEEQFLEILTSLKPILMRRMNSTPPTSKQNYQRKTKELKSIANVAVSYSFKKRSIIPGQHFVLQKSENIYCLCGKEVTKKNVNYKSHHIFDETLEIAVKNQIRIGSENEQSDSVQCVRNVKERKLNNGATSGYFMEQADCLQASSVKRKKTTLRKIAKKSRIALVELPSCQEFETAPPENRESQSEATSSKNRGGKPLTRNTTTALVIDLEKEPEGLNDVRYQ